MRVESLGVAALLVTPLSACGSSSSDGSGSGGSSSISCDAPEPRVTATPSFEPASIAAGQITNVNVVVPVTRTAHRVIISVSEIEGPSGHAIGLTEQAYNDAAECSVTVPIRFHEGVPAGEYFPELTIYPAPSDGGTSAVTYGYQSVVSNKNFTMVAPPLMFADSGIPISFISVK